MQLRAVLKSNHAVDNVFLENLVGVAADLLESLGCLVNFLLIWLVLIHLFILVNAAIKDLSSVVLQFITVLKCNSNGLLIRIVIIVWHHIQLNEASHESWKFRRLLVFLLWYLSWWRGVFRLILRQ